MLESNSPPHLNISTGNHELAHQQLFLCWQACTGRERSTHTQMYKHHLMFFFFFFCRSARLYNRSDCCRARIIVKLWQHFCQSVNLFAAEQLSCCGFHVVLQQHPTSYHFTEMRCVYTFYGYKRKQSRKIWQDKSLYWLVSLGGKRGEK